MRPEDRAAIERAMLAAQAPPPPPWWLMRAQQNYFGPERPQLAERPFNGLRDRDDSPVRVRGPAGTGSIEQDLLTVANGGWFNIPDYLRPGGSWYTPERLRAAEEFVDALRAHYRALESRREQREKELMWEWPWHWADLMLRGRARLDAA